jgi:hypothetical protein
MFHQISQHAKKIIQAMTKQSNRTFRSTAQNQKNQYTRQNFDPNKTPTMGDIYFGPGHSNIPPKSHIITFGFQTFGIFAGMGIYNMKSRPDHKQAQDNDNPAPKKPGK